MTARRLVFLATVCTTGMALMGPGPPPARARTHCCFELAADVREVAYLDYGDDRPQPYHGTYTLLRSWSVRSIVAFHETFIRHRPSIVDLDTEARLYTLERSNLTERHARIDSNGNYIYPYEPIPCGTDRSPTRTEVQGGNSRLRESGSVSLPKESNGYRLNFDVHSLFGSEPALCPGGGDLGQHRDQGADSPSLTVVPPKRRFLQEAGKGDNTSLEFEFPYVSFTHGGVGGIHTFSNERRARLRISWFRKSDLDAQRKELRHLKCGYAYCHDDWGKGFNEGFCGKPCQSLRSHRATVSVPARPTRPPRLRRLAQG